MAKPTRVISRIWHGAVPLDKADDYLTLMREVGLAEYRKHPGNRGAWCLIRREGDVAHFEMISFWVDVDAVKRFAGERFERSAALDQDESYLIPEETSVRHFGVYEN